MTTAPPDHPVNSRFVTGLFLLVFAIALALLLRLLFVFVTAIVLGLVLASLFWPIHTRLHAFLGHRKQLSATASTGLVVLLVLVPLVLLFSSLSSQAIALYQKASDAELVAQMRRWTHENSPLAIESRRIAERLGVDLSPGRLTELVTSAVKELGLFFYEQLGGIASNAFGLVLHFGMMVVLLYAFFAEGDRLKAYVLDLSPLPDVQEETIAKRFADISRAVFLGNGLGSVLQGLIGGASFYLFGIGSGALWGSAIAFFAFLPMVGASVILLPAAIYLFLIDRTGAAIGFLIFNGVQVFVLEYVVKTKLIGDRGHMNGVLVFFGMVAGIGVFGLLGLFYGPLVLTMFLTIAEIYRSHYRADLLTILPWPARPLDLSVARSAAPEGAQEETSASPVAPHEP